MGSVRWDGDAKIRISTKKKAGKGTNATPAHRYLARKKPCSMWGIAAPNENAGKEGRQPVPERYRMPERKCDRARNGPGNRQRKSPTASWFADVKKGKRGSVAVPLTVNSLPKET